MTSHMRLTVAGLFLAALLLLAYANHFRNGFYFDDDHTIVSNSCIRDIRNIPRFFTDTATFSSQPANRSYRPIVTTLNALDCAGGDAPHPTRFHVTIFVFYVIQGVVMFCLFQRIFDRAVRHVWNGLIALLAAAFYALHTANAETINYICARSDSFSTLCVLASLLLYQLPTTRKYHVYLLTMILGILTKETGVMFAPLLFLYVLVFEGTAQSTARRVWDALARTAPAIVVSLTLFLTTQVLFARGGRPELAPSRLHYLATQPYVIAHYLGNFILPVRLSADPDISLVTSIGDYRLWLGLVVTGALFGCAIAATRRAATKPMAFGIFWFFIALLPTSGFIPLHQVANDHRTFFPYVGLALASGWAWGLLMLKFEPAIRRQTLLKAIALLVPSALILAHAYGVRQRNAVWGSEEALWRDVTLKSPANGRGWMNYGLALMRQSRYDDALANYERAESLVPCYSYLHVNLGVAKEIVGQSAAAEQHFQKALQYDSQNPEAYYFYARWLHQQGRTDEASDLLAKGVALSPGHAGMQRLAQALQLDRSGAQQN